MALVYKHGLLTETEEGWIHSIINDGNKYAVLMKEYPGYTWMEDNLLKEEWAQEDDYGNMITHKGILWCHLRVARKVFRESEEAGGLLMFFTTAENHKRIVEGCPELVVDANPLQQSFC